MNQLPTLYKQTSTGAIQTWTIATEGPCITTMFGQLNGKMQTTSDTIKEGKNLGKANATTADQQAVAEAQAQWIKKMKKGYVKTLEEAVEGTVDAGVIEGGIEPMLAHVYDDHKKKIKFPAYVQPKLDGIRCIAVIEDGEVSLWSRTRKRINSMAHIADDLVKMWHQIGRKYASDGVLILDGELYNHEYRDNFEQIVSYVRQVEPTPGCEVVQYHIYDMVGTENFDERLDILEELLKGARLDLSGFENFLSPEYPNLHLVETINVANVDRAEKIVVEYASEGYEGGIIRNEEGGYENKRSYNLQKIKTFADDEFEIVGTTEGRGKLQNHLATFVCKAKNGNLFEAKFEGPQAQLAEWWKIKDSFVGKHLTVKYQGLTNKNQVPRFPVAWKLWDKWSDKL